MDSEQSEVVWSQETRNLSESINNRSEAKVCTVISSRENKRRETEEISVGNCTSLQKIGEGSVFCTENTKKTKSKSEDRTKVVMEVSIFFGVGRERYFSLRNSGYWRFGESARVELLSQEVIASESTVWCACVDRKRFVRGKY